MDTNQLVPPPPPPSDYPTVPPPSYVAPPTPSEGPLGSFRAFIQNTVDPMLGTVREGAGDFVKSALPIFSPPGIQQGQGPLGGRLLSGAVDLLNPIPGDTSDLLRDIGLLAVPGGGALRGALRVGAGTAGATAGAALSDKDLLPAAGTGLVGGLAGEGARRLTKNIGREGRQSQADIDDVTSAMNRAEPDLSLPRDIAGLHKKAFAPAGKGNLMDVTTPRYREMLDTVESRMMDPDRILTRLPDGADANFREAMDFIMRNSSAGGARKGPLSEKPPSARQQAMETIQVRESVIDALRSSPLPQEQALADIVQQETKRYFIDRTAARLLRAPGVLNKDTGLWNMRAAQEAFQKELGRNMVPADVYEDFQKAFLRGAKPPQMDTAGTPNHLLEGLMGAGGAVGTIVTKGSPSLGFHTGKHMAQRMVRDKLVGKTVGPSPLSQIIGGPVSLGTAQFLKELLSGLE